MAIMKCKKGSRKQLSANFHSGEFDCKCKDPNCDETWIDPQLITELQRLRDHFGKPLRINSGYRCAAHNKKVGGVPKSRHMQGLAADIRIPGVKPRDVAAAAEQIGFGGIGLYETDADGHFVHVDTRPTRTRWYGQKQERRESFASFTVQMRLLAQGCMGNDVESLQILLKGKGYDCGPVDGQYGKKTKAAVERFRQDLAMGQGSADGSVMAALLGCDIP